MEFYKSREDLERATVEAEGRFKQKYGDDWRKKVDPIVFAIDELCMVMRMCGRELCCHLMARVFNEAGAGPLTEKQRELVDGYLLVIKRYEGGKR